MGLDEISSEWTGFFVKKETVSLRDVLMVINNNTIASYLTYESVDVKRLGHKLNVQILWDDLDIWLEIPFQPTAIDGWLLRLIP